jgi:hypothetical protein
MTRYKKAVSKSLGISATKACNASTPPAEQPITATGNFFAGAEFGIKGLVCPTI